MAKNAADNTITELTDDRTTVDPGRFLDPYSLPDEAKLIARNFHGYSPIAPEAQAVMDRKFAETRSRND